MLLVAAPTVASGPGSGNCGNGVGNGAGAEHGQAEGCGNGNPPGCGQNNGRGNGNSRNCSGDSGDDGPDLNDDPDSGSPPDQPTPDDQPGDETATPNDPQDPEDPGADPDNPLPSEPPRDASFSAPGSCANSFDADPSKRRVAADLCALAPRDRDNDKVPRLWTFNIHAHWGPHSKQFSYGHGEETELGDPDDEKRARLALRVPRSL